MTFFVLMVLVALTPPWPARVLAAKGAGWPLLKETGSYAVYINPDSIETTTDFSTRVWYKTVAKTKAYKEFIQDIRMEEGHTADGYDKFSYNLSRVEIDCAGMRHRILEGADYDKNGKILGRQQPEGDWKKTHPDTASAALAAWVCDEHPLINDSLDDEGDVR